MEKNNFYNYIYLDPRKPGTYQYGDYSFDYEPLYVGKGKSNRLNHHFLEAKSITLKRKGKLASYIFENIITKGLEPIILKLTKNLSSSEALKIETNLILKIGRKCNNQGPLFNKTYGGVGCSGYKFTKQQKNKCSNSKKGINNYWYGKKFSEQHKANLRNIRKGINPHSYYKEESMQKMRDSKSKEWIIQKNDDKVVIKNLKMYCIENNLHYTKIYKKIIIKENYFVAIDSKNNNNKYLLY